ncbi:MAG: hypothetical protein PWQ86_1023 [Bacillota bacterium]|nr:hypothetical protein [Bacillota bacterium]
MKEYQGTDYQERGAKVMMLSGLRKTPGRQEKGITPQAIQTESPRVSEYHLLLDIAEKLSFSSRQLFWNINDNSSILKSIVSLSKEVTDNGVESAAGLEQCSSSIAELLRHAEEIDRRAQATRNECEQSVRAAEENRDVILKAGTVLTEVSQEVINAAEAIAQLLEVTKKIETLAGVIRQIAEHTNLVALNATIEAARVGEAGRGFAVVAEEVNKLSKESKNAAYQVKATILEVQEGFKTVSNVIAAGVRQISGVEEVTCDSSAALARIVGQLQDISATTNTLSDIISSHTLTIRELAKVVEELAARTEENVKAMNKAIETIERLEKSNQELLSLAALVSNEAMELQRFSIKYRRHDELIFAVNPFVEPQKVKELYVPILEAVVSQIGFRARTIIASDYSDLARCLLDGIADIGWFSPFAYVNAREQARVVPLVTPIVNGTPSYEGYIIVHRLSGITSLSQLQGRRVAFVDPKSASGYAFPRYLLKKAGVEPDRDIEGLFLGTHNKVIEAVLARAVDAGATYSEAWDMARQKGLPVDSELRIIAKTEPIPKDVIAARAGLPSELIELLKHSFINLKDTPPGKELLQKSPVDGFILAEEAKYDVFKRIMA